MAANATPIFSKAPDIQWIGDITTAHTAADLASGTSYLLFTADATNGGVVSFVRIKSNYVSGTSVATALRLWINNGSTVGTAGNSALFAEIGLPAVANSLTAATPDYTIAMPQGFALPAGYKLYLTIGTAPGGSLEYTATAVGGKF